MHNKWGLLKGSFFKGKKILSIAPVLYIIHFFYYSKRINVLFRQNYDFYSSKAAENKMKLRRKVNDKWNKGNINSG